MNQELDLQIPVKSGDHRLLEKYADLGDAAGKALTEAYRSGAGETDQGKRLPNLLAVAKFLKDNGYKVGKSKIYQDVKHIRQNKDGSYSEATVISYARRYLKLRGSQTEPKERKLSSELDRAQEEKVIQEARKLKAQADLAEAKARILQGDYITKDMRDRDLSNRASILRSDIENWARGQVAAIVTLVKGDIELIPDLAAYLLRQIDVWFARYAEDREFTVPKYGQEILSADNGEDL